MSKNKKNVEKTTELALRIPIDPQIWWMGLVSLLFLLLVSYYALDFAL